jgi:hypothetical protein
MCVQYGVVEIYAAFQAHAGKSRFGVPGGCRVFERMETFYLHLSHIITAERSTRAFTCIHVKPRIASNPNSASCIPTIAVVALKNCPILDGIGSAFVARWYPTVQFGNMAVEITRYNRDSNSVIF